MVKATEKSLKECGLDYINSCLARSPLGGPQVRRESWEAVAEAQKEGKAESIGTPDKQLCDVWRSCWAKAYLTRP